MKDVTTFLENILLLLLICMSLRRRTRSTVSTLQLPILRTLAIQRQLRFISDVDRLFDYVIMFIRTCCDIQLKPPKRIVIWTQKWTNSNIEDHLWTKLHCLFIQHCILQQYDNLENKFFSPHFSFLISSLSKSQIFPSIFSWDYKSKFSLIMLPLFNKCMYENK